MLSVYDGKGGCKYPRLYAAFMIIVRNPYLLPGACYFIFRLIVFPISRASFTVPLMISATGGR